MEERVTLIFDIGKTNKKLFLFDKNLKEIHQEYIRFDEIPDDDGFPSENMEVLTQWILENTRKFLNDPNYEITAINFSTYGASLVHLDESEKIIAPFYNYLKVFPEDLEKQFFEKYHGKANFSLITASPSMGFLNSGLQLYFLKYKKPETYQKIHHSLHFPQYLSFLLTGRYASDFTSVGCHTGLWDYRNNGYAHWVIEEGFDRFFPEIMPSSKYYECTLHDRQVNVGIGVHDSSAALIPYIQRSSQSFALISTGTWSICMNFFNEQELNKSELELDCLNFLGIKGHSIKASRLFLGQELRDQAKKLGEHFNVPYHNYKSIKYDPKYKSISSDKQLTFRYLHIKPERFGFVGPAETNLDQFMNFEHAHHQLMHELTDIQIESLKLAIGTTDIENLYIDGGFAQNELYVGMLAKKLPQYAVYSTDFGIGSSLGAAILVNLRTLPSGFMDQYQMKRHQ